MQPAGNEKHGPPSFPARPANSPFMAAPPTSMPSSSGPVVRSEALGYRAAPPARFNGPNIPSRPSYIPADAGSYQRTPTPQFSSSAQPAPPLHGPPIAGRPVLAQHVQPSVGQQSREQMQYPNIGPPVGAPRGLVEEFSSLSVGTVPGSIDPGIDSKALPRPLDGDVQPKSSVEIYSLNCNPRYFRLTTSAIPNSQSLLSRWNLPLGAVVHPP